MMGSFWPHGGELPVGTGEVGATMYDVLPAHLPAALLGALALIGTAYLATTGRWRVRPIATRVLASLIMIDGAVHLGLAITAAGPGWRLAYLGSAALAGLVVRRLLTGRSWRGLAGFMWAGALGGYWASSVAGHPVDQIGLVVKLVEIVGLYLTAQAGPASRRFLPGLTLVSAMLLNTVLVWTSAFRAGSGDLGVVSHHTGASPTPGMVMTYRSSEPASVEDTAYSEWLYAETVAALAIYADPTVAASAGYRVGSMAGVDFHAPNPAYQEDGRELDPSRPENLIYATGPDGPVLLGAMFETEGLHNEPPESGGDVLHWHRHEQVCLSPVGLTGLVDPFGLCPVGSLSIPTTNSMMHVWTVPGAPQRFGDLEEAWKQAYLQGLSS